MVDVKTYDKSGDKVSTTTVDETSYGDKLKKRLLHDAVLMYEACRRQGTHSTLTRAEVNRTTRKPYRQKGTGSARCGDFRSPLRRGGGVIFGPKPRDYSYAMPRKAKREALKNSLWAKLSDGEVFFLSSFTLETPSTKEASSALSKLEISGKSLILTNGVDEVLFRSFRNIAGVRVMPVSDVNADHMIRHRNVVFLNDAFDGMKERLGDG